MTVVQYRCNLWFRIFLNVDGILSYLSVPSWCQTVFHLKGYHSVSYLPAAISLSLYLSCACCSGATKGVSTSETALWTGDRAWRHCPGTRWGLRWEATRDGCLLLLPEKQGDIYIGAYSPHFLLATFSITSLALLSANCGVRFW